MLLADAHTHPCPAEGAAGLRLVCGTSPADWEQVARLADEDAQVIPFFGIHPWFLAPKTWPKDIQMLEEWLIRFPRAGVGETGLDKCRRGVPDMPMQQEALRRQLELAVRMNRPAALHCCRAWGLLASAVREYPRLRAILHGWTGALNPVHDLPSEHWLLSVGPQHAGRADILRNIPQNRLALESDGRPETLAASYREASQTLGIPPDELALLTASNLLRLNLHAF